MSGPKGYDFAPIPLPEVVKQLGGKTRAYRMKGPDGKLCQVFVGIEPVGPLSACEERWHLSISGRRRLPTWSELKAARDRFIPGDMFMAIPMPPQAYWLNVNPYVLHIWEYRDDLLTEQAKHEAAAAWQDGMNRPYGTET